MPGRRRGFILVQVLLVVLVVAAWATLLLSQAAAAARTAGALEDQLQARIALAEGMLAVARPPDLRMLCLSPPLSSQRISRGAADGGAVVVRWRHLGDALVLAEVDAEGPLGARARRIAWLAADSIDRTADGVRCMGTGLHPIGVSAVVARPGE